MTYYHASIMATRREGNHTIAGHRSAIVDAMSRGEALDKFYKIACESYLEIEGWKIDITMPEAIELETGGQSRGYADKRKQAKMTSHS